MVTIPIGDMLSSFYQNYSWREARTLVRTKTDIIKFYSILGIGTYFLISSFIDYIIHHLSKNFRPFCPASPPHSFDLSIHFIYTIKYSWWVSCTFIISLKSFSFHIQYIGTQQNNPFSYFKYVGNSLLEIYNLICF